MSMSINMLHVAAAVLLPLPPLLLQVTHDESHLTCVMYVSCCAAAAAQASKALNLLLLLLLQVTHDVSHLTCADFLRAPGTQTPVIVRFSTGARRCV